MAAMLADLGLSPDNSGGEASSDGDAEHASSSGSEAQLDAAVASLLQVRSQSCEV